MGLFTELLYPSTKVKKQQVQEDGNEGGTEDVAPKGEIPPPIQHFTLDGQVPNGGVPPGRLIMETPKPPAPLPPPEDPLNGGMAPQTQLIPCVNPGSIYARPWTQRSHTAVADPRPVYYQTIENHYHWHLAENPEVAPAPVPAKSHIRVIAEGVNPSTCYPEPYAGFPKGSDVFIPQTTSIKELHDRLKSNADGRGFQVVHKLSDNKWAPGPVFEWGRGAAGQQISDTVLGKGKAGAEIYVCSWMRP